MVRVLFKDKYWVLCDSVYRDQLGGWDLFGVRQDSTGTSTYSVHHEGDIINIQEIPTWWIDDGITSLW